MLRRSLITFSILGLTGCSSLFGKHNFIHEHEIAYTKSTSTAPLVVPENYSRANIGNDYPVPTVNNTISAKPISLLPPDSLADQIKQGKVSADILKKPLPPLVKQTQTTANNASTPTLAVNNGGGMISGSSLLLPQNPAQAWDNIGKALANTDYSIVNQNQKRLVYYILDTVSTDNKIARETPIYQIHLRDLGNGMQVYLTDNDNKPTNTVIAQRILNDLNSALSGNSTKTSGITQWLKELL